MNKKKTTNNSIVYTFICNAIETKTDRSKNTFLMVKHKKGIKSIRQKKVIVE